MMTQIVPKSWCSWDFKVLDDSRPVAAIAMSRWSENGVLAIDGATYRMYREVPFSGAFILEGAEGVLARAEKPSVLRREFVIRHAGRDYTLRRRAMFRRAFVLLDGSSEIGSIAPRDAFTRKAVVHLPLTLPVSLRMFMVWLTMILWKRDAE